MYEIAFLKIFFPIVLSHCYLQITENTTHTRLNNKRYVLLAYNNKKVQRLDRNQIWFDQGSSSVSPFFCSCALFYMLGLF